jgi:hypothetical protein
MGVCRTEIKLEANRGRSKEFVTAVDARVAGRPDVDADVAGRSGRVVGCANARRVEIAGVALLALERNTRAVLRLVSLTAPFFRWCRATPRTLLSVVRIRERPERKAAALREQGGRIVPYFTVGQGSRPPPATFVLLSVVSSVAPTLLVAQAAKS